MGIRFEDDYNLPLECLGLLYYLKYCYKKKVFSIQDVIMGSCDGEKEVKKILKRLIGHGYIRRSEEKGDWKTDSILGEKNPKLYRWEERQ